MTEHFTVSINNENIEDILPDILKTWGVCIIEDVITPETT